MISPRRKGYIRPFLLRGWLPLLGTLALLLLVLSWTFPVRAIDPGETERTLIVLTNVDRTSNGVAALLPDERLGGVARFRSEDMAARDYFSHYIPPDGHMVFDIMNERGIRYLRAGENLARNNYPDYITVETAEEAFMNSLEHRRILLCPDYTNLGTGAAEDGGGMKVYTVLFIQDPSLGGAPATQSPLPSPSPEPSATAAPTATPTPSPTPSPTATFTPSPTATPSPTPTPYPSPTATPAPSPSPTFVPHSGRVEFSPPQPPGLIEQIIRRVLSLFLNLG